MQLYARKILTFSTCDISAYFEQIKSPNIHAFPIFQFHHQLIQIGSPTVMAVTPPDALNTVKRGKEKFTKHFHTYLQTVVIFPSMTKESNTLETSIGMTSACLGKTILAIQTLCKYCSLVYYWHNKRPMGLGDLLGHLLVKEYQQSINLAVQRSLNKSKSKVDTRSSKTGNAQNDPKLNLNI